MGKILTPEEAAAMGLPPEGPVDARERDDAVPVRRKPDNTLGGAPDIGLLSVLKGDSPRKRHTAESDARQKEALLNTLVSTTSHGSMGTADKLAGILSMLKGGGYRKGQQSAAASIKAAQEAAPEGAILGALPYLAVGAAPTVAGRLATGATVGAGSGALNSPANLDEDPAGVAASAGEGFGVGLVTSGAAEGVSKLGGLVADYLRNSTAPGWALKAAGLRAGITNRAEALGLDTEDEALAVGREFLDKGLIPVAGSKAGVNARSETLRKGAGKGIDEALDMGTSSGRPPDFAEAQWKAAKPALEASAYERQNMAAPIKKLLRGLETEPEQSWQMLNRIKSKAGGGINWVGQPSGAPALSRSSYGELGGNIADQLERAAGPRAAKLLRDSNKDYSTALMAKALSGDEGLRALARQGLTVKDAAAGLGSTRGGSEGDPIREGLWKAAIAKLDALVKERGPALGARVVDDLLSPSLKVGSEVIKGSVPAMTAADPDAEKRKRLLDLLRGLGAGQP